MKRWIVGLSVLLVVCAGAGCVSMENAVSIAPLSGSGEKRPLTNIKHVYIGMTYEEVFDVMGDQFIVGYQKDSTSKKVEPITLKNPFRLEVIKGNRREYQVVYFVSDVQRPDGIIADDELIPLIFKQKKLIGKGADFLFQLKDRLNL